MNYSPLFCFSKNVSYITFWDILAGKIDTLLWYFVKRLKSIIVQGEKKFKFYIEIYNFRDFFGWPEFCIFCISPLICRIFLGNSVVSGNVSWFLHRWHSFLSQKETETGGLKRTAGYGSWLWSAWSQFCILFFIVAQRTRANATHSKSVSLTELTETSVAIWISRSLFIYSKVSDGVEFKKRSLNGTHKCFIRWESSRHKKKSVKWVALSVEMQLQRRLELFFLDFVFYYLLVSLASKLSWSCF